MPIADGNSRKPVTVPDHAYNQLIRYLIAQGGRADFSAFVRAALNEKLERAGLDIDFRLDREVEQAHRVSRNG